MPVSYTHLDVYKRQVIDRGIPPFTTLCVSCLIMIATPVTPPVTSSRGSANQAIPMANIVVPPIIMVNSLNLFIVNTYIAVSRLIIRICILSIVYTKTRRLIQIYL